MKLNLDAPRARMKRLYLVLQIEHGFLYLDGLCTGTVFRFIFNARNRAGPPKFVLSDRDDHVV